VASDPQHFVNDRVWIFNVMENCKGAHDIKTCIVKRQRLSDARDDRSMRNSVFLGGLLDEGRYWLKSLVSDLNAGRGLLFRLLRPLGW
jgi:hypothetical protein